ncbi:MAG TPA: universal stress protein, partial [Kofleriaceae bacterium]|nr:universal stress protein [Kofleriaceae bacterium]
VLILAATDFSLGAEAAVDQAAAIAQRVQGRMILVHVRDDADARRIEEVQARMRERGVDAEARVVDGAPAAALIGLAADRHADLIVVGSRGLTGFRRFLLGSVAERVVRSAPCAVLVARPGSGAPGDYRRILVPTDFSASAAAALALARVLAAPAGTIDLLHCWQVPYLSSGSRQSVQEASQWVRAEMRPKFAAIRERWTGDPELHCADLCKPPAHGIQWWIDQHAQDLVVVGHQGSRSLRHVLLGSVAEMTARYSPCSVLVARGRV